MEKLTPEQIYDKMHKIAISSNAREFISMGGSILAQAIYCAQYAAGVKDDGLLEEFIIKFRVSVAETKVIMEQKADTKNLH